MWLYVLLAARAATITLYCTMYKSINNPVVAVGKDWKHSIKDVWCHDPGLSAKALCCSPCLFGHNVEAAFGKSCCLYGCGYVVPYLNLYLHTKIRGLIRERRGIEGSTCMDLFIVWCAGPRALAQETLEVQSMNMDRS